jgi:lysophospholipase L1-like esterase
MTERLTRDVLSIGEATHDSGDGLHPSGAGARALADAIDLAIFRQDRARHR